MMGLQRGSVEKVKNHKINSGTWVWILFFLSVLCRFALANFYPKTINCYPDELLYLSVGDSFWNNQSVEVFNMPSSFSRVGYPLLLAPAFAFSSMRLRGMCIALINAILVSLGVFPAYHLAKKILKEKKHIFGAVGLYLISPMMTYSMTYMSENLYLPITMYFVYVCYLFLETKEKKKKIGLGVCLLFLSVIAYMIKSIALAFSVALVLLFLTKMVCSRQMKKILGASLLFVAGLLVGVLALKKEWIVWDFHVLQQQGMYILFGSVFFVLISVLAFCVVPVFLPSLAYKDMEENPRKLYLFLIYVILCTALVVSAMIYTTEDYPSLTPRAHTRYVEFLFVPLVILIWHLLEKTKKTVAWWKIWVTIGVWGIMQLLVFRGFSGQTMDQTMLFYWQLIARDGKVFMPLDVRILSGVVIAVAAIVMFLYNKNRHLFEHVFFVGVCVLCLANSVLSVYVQYKTHTHTKEETMEAEWLRAFVKEHEGEHFLVLEPDAYCELIDTYLIDCDNVRTGMEPIISQIEEYYSAPTEADYVLLYDEEYDLQNGVVLCKKFPEMGYSLYQVKEDIKLPEIVSSY